MRKYGTFEVVRTERRVPKKTSDPNADVDGLREYSYLRCPHCKREDIEILTCALAYNKSVVTRAHIAVCRAYAESRPPKRHGDASSLSSGSSSIVPNSLGTSAHPVGSACPSTSAEQPDESVETRLARIEHENRVMRDKMERLESKTTLYDGVLAAVMPSLRLPLTAPEETARITLREAAIKDIAASAALVIAAPSDVIAKNVHVDMLAAKDMHIAARDSTLAEYKHQLAIKNSELKTALDQKDAAVRRQRDVEREMHTKLLELNKTAISASSRADALQRERDALKTKIEAETKKTEKEREALNKERKALDARKRAFHMDSIGSFKAFEQEWMQKRARQGV